ncbi:Histone-lysine N-methyltransferase SETD2 [Dirofilaria immitis]
MTLWRENLLKLYSILKLMKNIEEERSQKCCDDSEDLYFLHSRDIHLASETCDLFGQENDNILANISIISK